MEKKPKKVDKWCQRHNRPKFYTPWGWDCFDCRRDTKTIIRAQAICGKEVPSRLK